MSIRKALILVNPKIWLSNGPEWSGSGPIQTDFRLDRTRLVVRGRARLGWHGDRTVPSNFLVSVNRTDTTRYSLVTWESVNRYGPARSDSMATFFLFTIVIQKKNARPDQLAPESFRLNFASRKPGTSKPGKK